MERGPTETIHNHKEVIEGLCPQGDMKLRPQQCWLMRDSTEAYIAEILGFVKQDVVIRKWQLQLHKKKRKGKTVREMARLTQDLLGLV